jgi:hypothetical protein
MGVGLLLTVCMGMLVDIHLPGADVTCSRGIEARVVEMAALQ